MMPLPNFRVQFGTLTAAILVSAIALCPQTSRGQSLSGIASQSQDADRQKELLQRIDRLEKRVAELEERLNQSARPALLSVAVKDAAASSEETASAPSAEAPVASLIGTTASPGPENSTANATPGRADNPASALVAAAQEAAAPTKPAKSEPFAFADWTWLNGNPRTKTAAMDTKFFTPEIRADVDYNLDFAHPADHTIGGSSEVFRSGEVQLTQLGVGGDFHFDNVRARLMTQFGMYAQTTPRNDASPAVGQWNLDTAYRYISEAYGGYHFNVMHGLNVDAGIFMSYIGLFSYYNFDNWAYQPSYVSSNTPWFFNGLRVQLFPTDKLKVEYWYINGWQSYGKFNKFPGMGGQILYRPKSWLSLVFNNYGMGTDTLGVPQRSRIHTDDSVEVKYYENPEKYLDRMAFSLTGDAGCEYGGGVSCYHNTAGGPKQSFLGFMLYNRWWFNNDRYGFTLGGGRINNPGRYLVLLPPINGADAITGSPYFPEAPGLQFKAWDASATFDYMPSQYITFRWEFDHRAANVPYFSGHGGITPAGGNTGDPTQIIPGFTPDLRKTENRLNLSILVKF
ncbi:MAG TPA: outer membrane beta-barrel protein [Candidatus Acidoferrales bacterium]|nr:outer membrane beta-barrel protein [Candidatus Acidoferrales bacterium]